MAGTERLKWTAMFVPLEEGFQRESNHSQKQSRCQTKRSMSPGAENRSRCALLTLSVPLRPRRDVPSLLLSGFSMELEARIWFAAPQRRYLRAMKTRPCAPGKINAPPRLTSQNISAAPFRLFSGGAPDAAGILRVVGKRGNTVTLLNPPRLLGYRRQADAALALSEMR